ncbi:MAG: ABC transporter substrate-binding protein [Thermoleophilia bacterium]|nr:ABC transporter substrate-binding protein [Thermoleophilia bacterium]
MSRSFRLCAVTALAAVTVLVAACGERAEPLARDIPPYPVTVAGARERPLILRGPPERVVALAPGVAELAGALGAGRRIVGAPADVVVRGAPRAARVVSPAGLVDVAGVVRLRPDLMLAGEATPADPLDAIADETRAPVYVQPEQSLRDVRQAMLEVALLLGDPPRGRVLAANLLRRIDDVERRADGLAPVPVFLDLGFNTTVPPRSLAADLVRTAGGRPLGTSRAGRPLGDCRVRRLRPAVVLVLDGIARRPFARRRCRGAPRFRGRIVELPADLVLTPGPRVGNALLAVARALHPNAFP